MAQIPEFKDFMPGMEFFQTLLKGAGMPSQFANWVAPTLDVEELEQKITDLKAVLGWLETHARMTQNMIQALEVQRMTVQALKTMNVDLQAFAQGMVAEPQAKTAAAAAQAAAEPEASEPKAASAAGGAPLFDPMQWWNTMTQQFTDLASQALQEGSGASAGFAAAAPRSRPEAAAQPARPAARKAASPSGVKAASKISRASAATKRPATRAKPATKTTAQRGKNPR